jgi:hypothetical protein
LVKDSWAFLDELVCLPLIGGGKTILRAFCSSALWQIYQIQYLLFRVQECRFTASQDTRIIVLSMGGMVYSLIRFRTPDPTNPPSERNHQLLLGRGAKIHLADSC